MAGEYLPPVVTRLTGDISDFVGKMSQAKAAVDSFKNSVQDTSNALKDMAASMDADNKAITSMSRRMATATAWQDKFKNAVQDTNNALRDQAATGVAASIANTLSAAGGGRGGGGYFGLGLLGRDISLQAGSLGLGSIRVWHVVADAALEAIIALTASVIDLTGAAVVMAPAAGDIANRLSAIQAVSGSLDANIPPLTGHFQQLAQQVAGPTIGAYGGLLNLLNGNGGAGQIFAQTADGLSGYIAKIDLWRARQGNANTLLQNGQGYLHQFGAMAASAANALGNIIKDDPGTVHALLGIAQGAASVVQWFSSLPSGIVRTTVALHGAWIWGSLAATGITRLIKPLTSLVKLTAGEEVAATFGSMVPLLGGIAVATVILANAWGSATNAVSRYVAAQNQAIGTMTPETFMNNLPKMINGLNDVTAKAVLTLPRTLAGLKELGQGLFTSNFGKIGGGIGNAVAGFFTNPIGSFNPSSQVAAEVGQWQKQWTGLITKSGNLVGTMANLQRAGYTTQQAFSIMALAGVRAGDSFALMQQKIKNLITGYGDLGTNAGMLTNAINATSFAAEQQQSRITAVTQGFTAFISTVTGGLANFVTFQQGMATLSTDSKAAGASMNGLNTQSLALQGQWATQINQASTLINSLYQLDSAGALGARGQQLLMQATKGAVAQMAPLAKGSTVARDTLYALAQQGGYRGADSLKALTQWAGNAKNGAKNLQAAMTTLTGAGSNLAKDVLNLSNAINPTMTGAMANAIEQATGGTTALEHFATAVINGTGGARSMTSASIGLWRQMRGVYGNTQQAADMFVTFATRLGISQGAANRLWTDLQASGGRATTAVLQDIAAINAARIAPKTLSIGVQYIGGSGLGGASAAAQIVAGARGGHFARGTLNAPPGWSVVGENGPELIRMRGGEHVRSNANSSFEGTGGDVYVESVVYLDGKQIYRGMQKQSVSTQRRNGHNGLTKRTR